MPAPNLAARWVRANGLQFACLEQGQGPLLLCLHGFPDTAWSYAPLLPAFAQAGFRTVAPFMRGYAPTSLAPDGDYSVRALAADVAALVEALGERQAFVLGHDWGAAAAYAAATLYPAQVRAIVTAAVPHLRRFTFWPSPRQLRRSRYMALFQLRGIAEHRIVADDFRWLRGLIREWSPGWAFSEADFAPLRAAFAEPPRLQAALSYYRALPAALADRANLRLLSTPVPVPALVVNGSDDGCIGPEMFERQEACFAAAYERATLHGCGHFMHCEQPALFAETAAGFFHRHSPLGTLPGSR